MPRPLYPPEKNPVPIIQEVGWGPGPVWTDAESLAYTGIQSPDGLACSESLYRLSCRGSRDAVLGKGNIPTLGFCLRWTSLCSADGGSWFLRNMEPRSGELGSVKCLAHVCRHGETTSTCRSHGFLNHEIKDVCHHLHHHAHHPHPSLTSQQFCSRFSQQYRSH
jgi:hypothetical protein